MSEAKYKEFSNFALYSMLPVASAFLRDVFERYCAGEYLDIVTKDDETPASYADRECEAILRDLISAQFPDHGIIGEEHGSEGIDKEFVWVLDPVDGTKEFLNKMPGYFSSLIALVHNGKPVLGLIHDPMAFMTWFGQKGLTSIPPRIPRRQASQLDKAVFACTSLSMFENTEWSASMSQLLNETVKVWHQHGNANGFGHVASGALDLACENLLKFHDIAALIPVMESAGGVAIDMDGKSLFDKVFDLNNIEKQSFSILTGLNEALVKEAFATLNKGQ